MSEGGKFLSIGFGNVGQAIPERAQKTLELKQASAIIKSGGIYRFSSNGELRLDDKDQKFWNKKGLLDGVEVAFMTIPSSRDERAKEIIEKLTEKGIFVVTAEKGALASYYKELEPLLGSVGTTATVGGGTRMMPWLIDRINHRTRQVHGIVNGTLNFFLDAVGQGRTAGLVIEEAVKLGYAEPGEIEHLAVLNGELVGDIPKKLSIFLNTVFRKQFLGGKFVSYQELKQPPLTRESLNRLIAEAGNRRYIFSMIKEGDEIPENDIIMPLKRHVFKEGWVLIGGFRRVTDNPLFRSLKLPGTGNGVVITGGKNESDGIYATSGPGAGPGPTAAAMVQDALHFLRKK